MADDKKNELDKISRVIAACGVTPPREQLDILELTWLIVASTARTEALISPGGFPAERTRQVDQLQKMAELVGADEPDLEMERLFQEGDIAGMLEHLRRQAGDAEKGGA